MVKIINKTILVGLFFLVLLIGCKDKFSPAPNKLLVARKKIDVFETYKGDSLKVIFFLQTGDQCSTGKEQVGKMFAYLEVVCPEKGHGWVVMGDGYEIVDVKSQR